jgi:hypothetical protein
MICVTVCLIFDAIGVVPDNHAAEPKRWQAIALRYFK